MGEMADYTIDEANIDEYDLWEGFEDGLEDESQIEMDENLCPLCSGPIHLIKHGKYGPFYGCNRYPHCRGSRKYIPEE